MAWCWSSYQHTRHSCSIAENQEPTAPGQSWQACLAAAVCTPHIQHAGQKSPKNPAHFRAALSRIHRRTGAHHTLVGPPLLQHSYANETRQAMRPLTNQSHGTQHTHPQASWRVSMPDSKHHKNTIHECRALQAPSAARPRRAEKHTHSRVHSLCRVKGCSPQSTKWGQHGARNTPLSSARQPQTASQPATAAHGGIRLLECPDG